MVGRVWRWEGTKKLLRRIQSQDKDFKGVEDHEAEGEDVDKGQDEWDKAAGEAETAGRRGNRQGRAEERSQVKEGGRVCC